MIERQRLMKTFKEFISEEGYDRLRDQGRIRPSKDKKDATTMPPSPEMKKTQKVYKTLLHLNLSKRNMASFCDECW